MFDQAMSERLGTLNRNTSIHTGFFISVTFKKNVMKFIAYNALPICFLLLAGFIFYLGKTEGWGWCIFGAVVTAVIPHVKASDEDENESE
jgi:uncharacterized BrkB/YihY/UPF0761 family membrane protein